MYKKILSAVCLLLNYATIHAQFAPQYPLPGNDAIAAGDARIQGWATGCTVTRGWKNIADTSLGKTTAGTTASPVGPPSVDVLSLGDGGTVILTFAHPIRNGAGPDFAVFENGFGNPVDSALAYLEFAFVAVSSDGENYFRFPATSNIQDTAQIDNFTYMDARKVNNLAGKYINGYGTPFDLEELKDRPGLDVQNIRFVKIIDVIGSLDSAYASFDQYGHIINDPFPSPYPTGGFDLNAVAVLNQQMTRIEPVDAKEQFLVFPNPARDFIFVTNSPEQNTTYELYDLKGRSLQNGSFKTKARMSIKPLSPGVYFLKLQSDEKTQIIKIEVQ